MEYSNGDEILKHFDSIFETNVLNEINLNDNKLDFLKKLFLYFEDDIYKPSEKYEQIRYKYIRTGEKLEETFTEEQQKLFERYFELGNQLAFEEEMQLFCFGYIIAKKLDI